MKNVTRKRIAFLIPIVTVAILLTITGVYFHQSFLKILPLYISLFVMTLSANVSRYALLVGGVNSVLYAMIYFSYQLYGMAAYALFISFPIQMISFILWKKHAYRQSVTLKKLTAKQRLVVVSGFLVAWFVLYIALRKSGASYALLDNTVTLFGVLISVLQMLAYIEYTYLMIPNGLATCALYIQMLFKSPEQMTYLVFSMYSLVCVVRQYINAKKLYQIQNSEGL